MPDMEERLAALEKETIQMASLLRANTKMLDGVQKSLEKLTVLQIDRAKDKAEICARIDECDRRISAAHTRIDTAEGKHFKIYLLLSGTLLTAFVSLLIATHGGSV